MRKNQPITVYGSITCGLDVNGKYVYNTGIRVLLSWAAGLPAPGALARSLSNLAAPAALSLRGSRGRASRLAPPRSPSPSRLGREKMPCACSAQAAWRRALLYKVWRYSCTHTALRHL